MDTLFNIFSQLEDPRDNRGKKHRLIDVIVLAIYGILCGYTDFSNMAYFLRKYEDMLSEELGLLNGIPSHDTFSAVFRAIDSNEFMRLFIEWTQMIVKEKIGNKTNQHIAIDGKAIIAASKKVEKGNIPYIVSGFLGGLGISIGQVKVDDKSNEITAIPDLLDLINIEGCTVTIDAIGTQTKIVEKIINKKGNYCLSVKENQCSLYEDIKAYFDFALDDEVETKNIKQYTTEEKDHGRYEKRKYYISDNLFYVNDAKKWKGLVAIGYVDRLRDVNGEIEKSKNYYILSKSLDSEEFGECVRGHWAIENKLHWVLDVIFNEDHSTSKKDRAIENISIIRKIVFNLTKLDPQMAKKSTKKKIIDYTFDFSNFKRLIYEVIPSSTTL